MKRILVIGSTGQIGSALMTKLRSEYGSDNVVAGYIEGVPLSDELKNGGPLEVADVTQRRPDSRHRRQIQNRLHLQPGSHPFGPSREEASAGLETSR